MKKLALIVLVGCSGPTKSAPNKGPGDLKFESPEGQKLNARDQPADDAFGEMQVVGAIPKDAIHRVVRENFNSLRQCYEQLLMANPGLQGKVVAKFDVGIDGAVSAASAEGVHPDLETCVVAQVRKFKFPRPDGVKGDVQVIYPFTFKP
jgi:outer membrane biosynthesis protein TonB